MLTKLSVISSVSFLTIASTIIITPDAASAGPCHNSGNRGVCSIGGTEHRGGTSTPGSRGGGKKSSTTAPPCPVGPTMNCGVINNPAPPAHVPTIDVAYSARDELEVPAPHVNTAPSPRTYVQLKTGLWVDKNDYTGRSKTLSDPNGDQSVTITATPQSVTWNMGEKSIICHGPGVAGRTICGYTYRRSSADQPGGHYSISATISWALAWTCTGNCDAPAGTLNPLTMTTTAPLAVGEVQTQSRPG